MTATDPAGQRGAADGGHGRPGFPSSVEESLSAFDRAATWTDGVVSRAGFFIFCLATVLIWLPSFFVIRDMDTWQLIINTVTTIVVFLLMALLQNTQKRADSATQHKLNAIADGLADLMDALAEHYPDLDRDEDELREAVGLEDRESSQ